MAFKLVSRGSSFRLVEREGKPTDHKIPFLGSLALGATEELLSPYRIFKPRTPAQKAVYEAAQRQHPVASGLGRVAGFLPAFAVAEAPVSAALKAIPAVKGLATGGRLARAGYEGIRQAGQFGLAEALQGRPQESGRSAAIGAALGPVSTIQRFIPRVAAGALTLGGLSAASAPPGQRLQAGAFGAGMGAFGSLAPSFRLVSRGGMPTTPSVPNTPPESWLISARSAFPEEFTTEAASQAAREGFGEMVARQPIRTEDLYRAHYGEQAFPKREGGFVALPEEEGVRRAARGITRASAPTFYSYLERTLDERMPNAATPDQVRGIIRSAGVSHEELANVGLENFLAGKAKVTKQDVLDYVKQNNVQVQEVVKGRKDITPESIGVVKETIPNMAVDRQYYVPGTAGARQFAGRTPQEVVQNYIDFHNIEPSTKFQSYQLPGGTNYRELLLTLPDKFGDLEKEAVNLQRQLRESMNKQHNIETTQGITRESGDLVAEQERLQELIKQNRLARTEEGKKPDFRSSHFDEPNVLAHVRFNDRVDAQGKKVLFIEEVQSDWHQKGRKEGYRGAERTTLPSGYSVKKEGFTYHVYDDSGYHVALGETEQEAVQSAIKRVEGADPLSTEDARRFDRSQQVPNAPFKKTWHELALKRMIRWAAENGYDKLAWTTGEQQAARYDLSKQVDQIGAVRNKNGTYGINAATPNGMVTLGHDIPAEKLADNVGKDLAAKIVTQPEGLQKYSGLDLKVGGEGMKGFYDQMIPSFLNRYAKKWGGRVGTTTIDEGNDLLAHQTYSGPQYTAQQLRDFRASERQLNYSSTLNNQLTTVIINMERNLTPFAEAMSEQSAALATSLGGQLSGLPRKIETVHSLDLTPAMKSEVLTKGQRRFGGFVALPEEEAVQKGVQQVARAGTIVGVGELASPTRAPEQTGRVQRIVEALREAKPVRRRQEALYTQERSARMGAALGARETGPGGEAGYYRELGQLKGELPKAQYEAIREKIPQADVNELFNDITSSNLNFWQSVSAREGLLKMFNGSVPTDSELTLLNKVFGHQLPAALAQKRPLLSRLGLTALDVLGSMRAMSAGLGDMSLAFRQAIIALPRYPVKWATAFSKMHRYFFDPKFYEASMKEIASRPTYQLMQDSGLHLTGLPGGMREEPFQASLPERIPGLRIGMRAAERAYSGMGNRLRADIFDKYALVNQLAGSDVYDLSAMANLINTMTGRGTLRYYFTPGIGSAPSLAKAAPILNATLFSPRLLASRINMLDPMYYASLPKTVRQEAVKAFFAFVAAGTTTLGLAKAAGIEVGTNHASADFGKMKSGNTRVDIWGGFQQPVVMALRVLTQRMVSSVTGREFRFGEGYKSPTSIDILQRFVGSKVSPPVRLAMAIAERKGFAGEPVNVPAEVLQAFIPMFASDVYELLGEDGGRNLWLAPLSYYGMGVQTYGRTVPNIEKTAMGRPTVRFRSAPNLGETIVRGVTGERTSNIPEGYHQPLSRLNLQMQVHQADVDKAKYLTAKDGTVRRVRDQWGDTKVWVEQGQVKTKTFTRRQRPEEAVRQLQQAGALK